MNLKVATSSLLAMLLVVAACSSDDDPAPAAPILTITNTWVVEGGANHSFNFVSSEDGELEGTFFGEEATPDGGDFDLDGTWTNGRITFTVERDETVTYTARFSEDNPTRLVFESDAGQLVLLLGE